MPSNSRTKTRDLRKMQMRRSTVQTTASFTKDCPKRKERNVPWRHTEVLKSQRHIRSKPRTHAPFHITNANAQKMHYGIIARGIPFTRCVGSLDTSILPLLILDIFPLLGRLLQERRHLLAGLLGDFQQRRGALKVVGVVKERDGHP